MKWLFTAMMFLTAIVIAKAQTFDEWFRQKKTQKKYLMEQINAFQNYLATLKKGYAIVQKGSQLVYDIKADDSAQHRKYMQSLSDINPAIRHANKVNGIVQLQQQVIDVSQYAIIHAASSAILTAGEAGYIRSVFDNLLSSTEESLRELQALLTPGKYRLSDDERLQRINNLYADMQVKYAFAMAFRQEAGVLGVRRLQDRKDIKREQTLLKYPN